MHNHSESMIITESLQVHRNLLISEMISVHYKYIEETYPDLPKVIDESETENFKFPIFHMIKNFIIRKK